jgi:hypothetical protein
MIKFKEIRVPFQLEVLENISGDDRWAHGPVSKRFRRQEDREMLVRHINELRDRANNQ